MNREWKGIIENPKLKCRQQILSAKVGVGEVVLPTKTDSLLWHYWSSIERWEQPPDGWVEATLAICHGVGLPEVLH